MSPAAMTVYNGTCPTRRAAMRAVSDAVKAGEARP